MKLHFQLWPAQQGEKAKLIFLHGMGGTGALWRPIAATLENHFTILAPDQRGHGKSRVSSEALTSYAALDFGKDLIETMESADFHPAWLVGHSMGVRTACAAGFLRPEWVRGLVLIDLGFHKNAAAKLPLADFLGILPESFDSREAARVFMAEHSPDPAISQYLMAVSAREPSGRLHFPFDRGALLETLERASSLELHDWIDGFAQRGTPILALRGERSTVWTREDFDAERARYANVPSMRFEEVAQAGHGLPFERRSEFIGLLEGFLAGSAGQRKPS